MTRPIWERINPREHADGVFYVPAMLELQPRQPHWGHPGMPERVNDDRPHGANGGKLLCLLCMRTRAENNLPPEPIWLTFVNDPRKPHFRHENGRSPHAEHEPETDVHKALKEREARTFEAAGAAVHLEMWHSRAQRRPDVAAVGPRGTVNAEVQHSEIPARTVQARTKALSKTGERVVWTTDLPAGAVKFLHRAPHLVVPHVKDFRYYLDTPRLKLTAGAIVFERQRCGWADMWTGTQRCPVTRKAIPCGRWHLYPTYEPRDRFAFPTHEDARFPATDRPHLDHLLEGILHGQWTPYRRPDRTVWVPAGTLDELTAERGGVLDRARVATARRRDERAERTCENRFAVPFQITPEQATSPVCLTCRDPTANRDRYGAPRCESCCTWLGVA